MTIKEVSFRDFLRGYIPADVLLLLDKKSKTKKGLYIKPEYADEVMEFIEKKELDRKEKKKKALLDFVGKFGDDNSLNRPHKEIKASKYE